MQIAQGQGWLGIVPLCKLHLVALGCTTAATCTGGGDDFHSSPRPEVFGPTLGLWCLPVDAVVGL